MTDYDGWMLLGDTIVGLSALVLFGVTLVIEIIVFFVELYPYGGRAERLKNFMIRNPTMTFRQLLAGTSGRQWSSDFRAYAVVAAFCDKFGSVYRAS